MLDRMAVVFSELMSPNTFHISPETAKSAFVVSLTVLVAVLVDNLFRLFIKAPKHLDNRRARTYVAIFRNLVTILVYAVGLHFIFLELNINITTLLASAGIIGVVVGIGARSMIEDFISGIFLVSQDSIAVGDYVKIDTDEGYIENIGFRTLTIRGENGALYVIPNGQVKRVVNFSRSRSSVFVDIPVKGDEEIDTVLQVAKVALAELYKDPEVASALSAGSSIDGIEDVIPAGPMVIRATLLTYPAMRLAVARKYRYLVKKGFEKKKIAFW